MDREEEGEARRSVRGSAGEKSLWWDDGTDEKSRGREGGGDSSPSLCRCSRATSCATATLRLFSVCLNRSIIIRILIIRMTTTMLKKKYI